MAIGTGVDGKVSVFNKFASRDKNENVSSLVQLKSAVYGALAHEDVEGKSVPVNVMSEGQESATAIAGAGFLTTGSIQPMQQGFVLPRSFYVGLSLQRETIQVLQKAKDAADLVKKQEDSASKTLAYMIGRSSYGSQLIVSQLNGAAAATSQIVSVGTFSGAGTAVSTAYRFRNAASAFRPNLAVNLIRAQVTGTTVTSATISATVTVTNVTIVNDTDIDVIFTQTMGVLDANGASADAAVNAALLANINAGGAGVGSTADQFWVRGVLRGDGSAGSATLVADMRMDSLQDISAATGDLYTIPVATTPGWTGVTVPAFGTLLPGKLSSQAMGFQEEFGSLPSHVLLSSRAATAYAVGQLSNGSSGAGGGGFGMNQTSTRRNVDGMFDVLNGVDGGLRLLGAKVLADPSCPASDIYLINKDAVGYAIWQKPGVVKDGGAALLLNRQRFTYDMQFSATLNIKCENRKAVRRLAGCKVDDL